jgi:hypothetical protein
MARDEVIEQLRQHNDGIRKFLAESSAGAGDVERKLLMVVKDGFMELDSIARAVHKAGGGPRLVDREDRLGQDRERGRVHRPVTLSEKRHERLFHRTLCHQAGAGGTGAGGVPQG